MGPDTIYIQQTTTRTYAIKVHAQDLVETAWAAGVQHPMPKDGEKHDDYIERLMADPRVQAKLLERTRMGRTRANSTECTEETETLTYTGVLFGS